MKENDQNALPRPGVHEALDIFMDAVNTMRKSAKGVDVSHLIENAERAMEVLYSPAVRMTQNQMNLRDALKSQFTDLTEEADRVSVQRREYASLPPDERMGIRCDIMARVLKCDADSAVRLASWAEKKGLETGVEGLRGIASDYLNRYVLNDRAPELRDLSELTQNEQTALVVVFVRLVHKFRRLTEDALIDLACRECSLRGVDFDPAGAVQAIVDDPETYFETYREFLDDDEVEKAAVEGVEITPVREQMLKLLAMVIDIYNSGDADRYKNYEQAMRECIQATRESKERGSARFADFLEDCLDNHRYPAQQKPQRPDDPDDVPFDAVARSVEIAKSVKNADGRKR